MFIRTLCFFRQTPVYDRYTEYQQKPDIYIRRLNYNMKRGLISIFLLLFLAPFCSAQENRLFTQPLFSHTNYSAKPIGIFNTYSFSSASPNVPSYRLNYELPKAAIFCWLEDVLYKHFNFWIKFRMGNDDRYSN
jgi:hypothetical protein